MSKFMIFILAGLLPIAYADQPKPKISFVKQPYPQNVFATTSPDTVYFTPVVDRYSTWLEKYSGKTFPMDVAPALSGVVSGKIHTPPVEMIRESDYKDRAAEFARVLNERNHNGRPQVELTDKTKTPAENLKLALADTYVVEITLSAIVDVPLQKINLSPDRIAHLPEQMDTDHYHYQIPGAFAQQAFEEGHSAFATVRPDGNYLLSVFDLREYNCAIMQNGIRDYFSKAPEREQLKNESIYLISELKINQANDFAEGEKLFGKRPDAVIRQNVLYADHLVRAAETLFVLYAEGSRTRLVLISNVAMKSKYFKGTKGMLISQWVMDGITGASGVAGAMSNGYIKYKEYFPDPTTPAEKEKQKAEKDKADDALNGLLAPAEKEVTQKNSCDKGLGLGLIRYSQSLLTKFIAFTKN